MVGPIVDATGLKGEYDLNLYWTVESEGPLDRADPSAGPLLPGALQSQLGLHLEPKKGSYEVFVIDHIEKTPTEN